MFTYGKNKDKTNSVTANIINHKNNDRNKFTNIDLLNNGYNRVFYLKIVSNNRANNHIKREGHLRRNKDSKH